VVLLAVVVVIILGRGGSSGSSKRETLDVQTALGQYRSAWFNCLPSPSSGEALGLGLPQAEMRKDISQMTLSISEPHFAEDFQQNFSGHIDARR